MTARKITFLREYFDPFKPIHRITRRPEGPNFLGSSLDSHLTRAVLSIPIR